MKYKNLTIASRKPMSDAQMWQLAQDVQTAYRAALKPTAVLPTGLDAWLGQETQEIQ